MLRNASRLILWFALAIPVAAGAGEWDEIELLKTPAEKADAYRDLLGAHPDSAEILFKLGNAYYDMEMFDEAIASFRRSLRAGGERPVMINLTYVLEELNRPDEADRTFRDFLEENPLDPLAHAFYADFLAGRAAGEEDEEKGKVHFGRAAEEYRRALEIDPKSVEARFGLGVLFARAGILEEAIREWKGALNTDGRHRLAPRLRVNIADAEKRLGR